MGAGLAVGAWATLQARLQVAASPHRPTLVPHVVRAATTPGVPRDRARWAVGIRRHHHPRGRTRCARHRRAISCLLGSEHTPEPFRSRSNGTCPPPPPSAAHSRGLAPMPRSEDGPTPRDAQVTSESWMSGSSRGGNMSAPWGWSRRARGPRGGTWKPSDGSQ